MELAGDYLLLDRENPLKSIKHKKLNKWEIISSIP